MVQTQPARIHVLAKPTGAICNLNCSYCFFLDKEQLYPDSTFRMSDQVLEAYIRQLIESHRTSQVTIAWQGGESTLMGIDFYRQAIALQEKYRKPGMTFENTMQTNGTLLNDEWCEFFKANNYLDDSGVTQPYQRVDGLPWDSAVLAQGKLIKIRGFPKDKKVKLFRIKKSSRLCHCRLIPESS